MYANEVVEGYKTSEEGKQNWHAVDWERRNGEVAERKEKTSYLNFKCWTGQRHKFIYVWEHKIKWGWFSDY